MVLVVVVRAEPLGCDIRCNRQDEDVLLGTFLHSLCEEMTFRFHFGSENEAS